MSTSPHHIVLFVYNSFRDPLFQGLLLTYLKRINNANSNFHFHIVTYEQKKFTTTSAEKKKIIQDLRRRDIYWYPLTYHTGRFILVKKAWDFILGFCLVLKLKIQTGSKVLLTFTNIAGSVGFIFSRVLNFKFIVYSYEPHSEFLADFGLWSRKSFKFNILNKLERLMGYNGEYILTGTTHMVNKLKDEGAKGKIYRLPSCVDEGKFRYNAKESDIIRSKFRIGDRKCIIYVGKFGDLYYKEEIPQVLKTLLAYDPNFFCLILTPDDLTATHQLFLEQGLDESSFAITYSRYEDIQNYISAGDIGLIAIKPTPSQKFRSPVKTGEYLMCGKPYIVCEGISEDDFYATFHKVGVVVKNFSQNEIEHAIPEIDELLSEDKLSLGDRCRTIGKNYRGLNNVVPVLQDILEDAANLQR